MRADIWLGVITVFMAVLGGIVSAHAPTKLWHRIVYASTFVLAGAMSIWLVIRISNENAAASRELSVALKNLGNSTTNIAAMTALNTQLQERLLNHSDTITNLSKQNIAAVTGGNTFCYVSVVFSNNKVFSDNKFAGGALKIFLEYFWLCGLAELPSHARFDA